MYGAYQKVLESELKIGRLNLGPADDKNTLSFQQNKRIAEKILKIVAKDSSTDAAKVLFSRTEGSSTVTASQTKSSPNFPNDSEDLYRNI